MHVALNGWFWDQPYTGSGRYLRNLLIELSKIKDDLQLSLIISNHIEDTSAVPENVTIVNAPTRLGGKLGKVWFEQRAYPAKVKAIGADIAHVPYWGGPLSSEPARLVTSVLDIIPRKLPEYRTGLGVSLYTSLVEATARGSAHIITLSEDSKRDIVNAFEYPPERVSVTYLAADDRFDAKRGAENDEAVRQKYDLPDEFAFYVGSYDRRKNVNNLLLAWTYAGPSLGQQVPLVLAGNYPKEDGTLRFPALKDYAKQLEIDQYVMWLGRVDEEDLPSLYRLATTFVFPSKYEGFGLPILEAMASGTAVVASNASSLPEVAGDAAYLVDPDDAREMSGAIIATMVQDDLNEHLVALGRGQVTNFSWRKTARQTYEIYQQVMEA